MIASTRIRLSDLGRQKRLELDLTGSLTPEHTVGHAIELYLDEMGVPSNDLRWMAFSRGNRLDPRHRFADLEETFADITVLPEVSAG